MLPLTPPYDVRPAFEEEIKGLQKLIINNFGKNATILDDDDIVLLNKIGSEDQMDEIIISGSSIGIRRFDLISEKWILKLNSKGLSLLEGKFSKKWVKVDDGAKEKIIQGANILIPGVIDADSNIQKGDYLVIVDENNRVIAGGISRINESDRKDTIKGVYAKNYLSINNQYAPNNEKRTWEEIVRWNMNELKRIEKTAVEFILKAKEELKLPLVVSFSGGKDSLVTLALVKEAIPEKDFKVLFVDTGIEFQETIDHVKECSKQLDFDDILITESVPTELFWESFDKYGPPGRDFRHCCKFAKLAPIKRALEKTFGDEKCISFVGQRRYESYRRASTDVWENKYINNQINMSPIQNWTAFMIWLYIFWKKLPYNSLYETGYERIGCWTCPSSNMAQFQILEKNHPDLYQQLFTAVEKWRETRNLPDNYWKYGLWRFKKIPTKIANTLSLDAKDYDDKSQKIIFSDMQIETSDCITQPMSIIGMFTRGLNLNIIASSLPILGKVQYNKKLNFIRISNKSHSILLYNDGTFRINFKSMNVITKTKIQTIVTSFVYTVMRSLECVRCGLCLGKCNHNAISFNKDSIQINNYLCIKCNQCSEVCPIVTIVYRSLGNIIKDIIRQSGIE